jgi:hypothetical protein
VTSEILNGPCLITGDPDVITMWGAMILIGRNLCATTPLSAGWSAAFSPEFGLDERP